MQAMKIMDVSQVLRLVTMVALFLVCSTRAQAQSLSVHELRCDWAVNPLGVDASPPRLSWKLRGEGRGLEQSAWQVLAASSRDQLDRQRGDLWDSGRVPDDAQLHVPYAGMPLRTAQQVFWKVRVWDGQGRESNWSEPATWTMGVVDDEGWTAPWITSPEWLRFQRAALGYSSRPTTNPREPKWVQLDLGAVHAINEIRLHALVHTVPERLGFPRWFRVEVAEREDFSDATVVVDHTENPTNLWLRRLELQVPHARGRFVRLTTTQLRMMAEDDLPSAAGDSFPGERGRLALSQVEILSGGRNVAVGARVTASDSLEDGLWAAAALVDGLGAPGANPVANQTLRLRREFPVAQRLRRALLFVSGLGHYTLSINGRRVGDSWLTPGWTQYEKTCLYDTHDVTALLQAGENALGLTLAGGMFNVQTVARRYNKFVGPYRPLVATAQLRLEYEDGRVEHVKTDHHWRTSAGPIVLANMYAGEDYDARREDGAWDRPGFADESWTAAVVTAGPGGRLKGSSHAAPPLRAHETLTPVAVRRVQPGTEVYDLGQNASVIPRLRVRGPAGAQVKIIPAELVRPDGSVDRSSVGGSEASWNYMLRGRPAGEEWVPQFFYHGARYLQVVRTSPEGAALPTVEELVGLVVHSDSVGVGDFSSSSDLFNRIRLLVRWAQRSNLAHVLTDCPHRERLGWLEQYHLNGPSLRYEFDLACLFRKTFGDMADAQRPSGLVPDTAPEYVQFEGGFRDSPEWGSAFLLAAWQQYQWTGDDAALRQHYDGMRRYIDYLGQRADNHVLSHGLGDWYDLGPDRPGISQLTPVPVTATALYQQSAHTLSRMARLLGREDEARRYGALAEMIASAFNREFLDQANNVYATGSQTAHALPLVLGIVPESRRGAVLEKIVSDIRRRGDALTSGDVGYRYLLRALARGGRSDVIFDMNHQVEKPGYGFQLERGATSLTEAWDANRNSSQNHFMLGQIMEWFYHDLAGIAGDENGPGFKQIMIRPQPVGDLTWVEASHESPRGRISSRWERRDGRFSLAVVIPPNATATVYVPAKNTSRVLESGQSAGESEGVRWIAREGDRTIYRVGSGEYRFESEW